MTESLDCDHCGGDAITSETGLFTGGQVERCDDCGFPGCVYVDDEDLDGVTAYWRCSDEPGAKCNDRDCRECNV